MFGPTMQSVLIFVVSVAFQSFRYYFRLIVCINLSERFFLVKVLESAFISELNDLN